MTSKQEWLYLTLGVSSLAFAFFWLPVPRLFDVACYLLILLFVPMVMAPANRDLRQNPVIQLGFLFFLFTVFSIIWHRLTLPDYFPNTTSDRRFLRVLYFVAIAYAISRSHLLTPWRLLVGALAGLTVYMALQFNSAEWLRAWQGERVDFDIHNAQHTGIVFSTCTLALSFFSSRFYGWARTIPRAAAILCAVLWICALLFSAWVIFVSQTRAVWLGLCVSAALLPVFLALAHRLHGQARLPLRRFALAGAVGATLLGLLAIGTDTPAIVSERFNSEKVTWESLRQAATHEEHDLSSIEIRIASWSASAVWIMERPLMGWGGRGSRPLIRNSDFFSDAFKERFNHLHNSYLQVIVEIGFIGAMFIAILMALIGRASIKAYQQRQMPLDVFLFAWTFFIFWLVVSFFESYIIYSSGTYLVGIVTAFFYSYCLEGTALQKSTEPSPTSHNQIG